MCEVLIKLVDHNVSDSEKDRRATFKRCYVIEVMENGHSWQRMERKGEWKKQFREQQRELAEATWHNKTALVQIPDMSVSEALPLMDEQTEDDNGVETGDVYRKRRWYVDLDSVPPDRLNPWLENGEIVSSKAEFTSYVFRIRDNAPWPS